MQYTPFKWNAQHISTLNITIAILFMWLCIVHYVDPMIVMLLIEVEPELEITPFVEDTVIVTEPRQQGKQTPLVISIKSQFLLSLAYACLGDHFVSIYRMTYHLVTVVSKPQS